MSNEIEINKITIQNIKYTNGPIQLNGEITLTINGTEETYTIQDGKPTLKTTETILKTGQQNQETEPRKAISHSRNVARQATININDVVEGLKQMFQQGQEQPQPQEPATISLDFNKLTSKDLAGELNTIFNPPITTN